MSRTGRIDQKKSLGYAIFCADHHRTLPPRTPVNPNRGEVDPIFVLSSFSTKTHRCVAGEQYAPFVSTNHKLAQKIVYLALPAEFARGLISLSRGIEILSLERLSFA